MRRICAFICLAAWIGLPYTGMADAGSPLTVRVLSYNIHHGEGVDGKLDLERIAGIIRAVSPDVVALQEVDQGVRRSDRVDQPAELARLTGMQVVFGKNIDHEGGNYGNAVLSKFRIESRENVALPSFYDGEQRGALCVRFQANSGAELQLIATHLDYRPDDSERMASAEMINNFARRRQDQPAILAGDLNARPESRVLARLGQFWQTTGGDDVQTFPAKKPTRQIDYILFRPAHRWRVKQVRVLDEAVASDHRPLLAVLELRPAE